MLLAAVAVRPNEPRGPLAGPLASPATVAPPSAAREVVLANDEAFEVPVDLMVTGGAGAYALVLAPREPLVVPAMVVYWAPAPGTGDGLPEGAQLLGAFDGVTTTRWPLPHGPTGAVVIYSLGHQRVVDRAPIAGDAGAAEGQPAEGVFPQPPKDATEPAGDADGSSPGGG